MNTLQRRGITRDSGWLFGGMILLALLSIVGMYARPLTPIDETRYVSVAWEMWLRGDFLVPVKNGLPYSDKPPLLLWLYQAGWALFGVNDWWPRLVSPLTSAACLLLVQRLGKLLWPDLAGIGGAAALILASCLLWILFSTAAMFDVLLAFCALLGMHGTLAATAGRKSGFLLLAVAIGLGVLAKGPVILLHVLPVALLAPWWMPGLSRKAWLSGLAGALLLGAAIALVWAIPAALSGGESYQQAIFWGQTAGRMVKSFAHRHPFWWYLPLLPVLLFPWILLPSLWRGCRHWYRDGLDTGSRFCLAWSLPTFVTLSLISGKQVHYLVPLLPVFALLAARILLPQTNVKVSFLPAVAGMLGGWLVAMAVGWVPVLDKGFTLPPVLLPALLLVVLAPATWGLSRLGYHAIPVLASFSALAVALLQLAASPAIQANYDVTLLASSIRAAQEAGRTVANDGLYHDQFHFAGRLTQPLVAFDDQKELKVWLRGHPEALVVLYLKDAHVMEGRAVVAQQRYIGRQAFLVDAPIALQVLAVTDESPDTDF
ncbi:MAG TPA: glycosyltransferase family 39 protein [Pseudomonadales bacterium]|nr:glycosyltransferase family 39 protein [Pseudomonadales bacterium]